MRQSQPNLAALERLNLGDLLRLAANDNHEGLAARALGRAVGELLEIEVEHRLTGAHINTGYASASPLAFAGMGASEHPPGQSDRVAHAAIRYRGENAWRGLALMLLSSLREPTQQAVLVSAYIIRPTGAVHRSPRMMTSAEACEPERLATIYQRLGWPPQSTPAFTTPKSLNHTATHARRRMRQILAARIAAAVTSNQDPAHLCHESP